ncbi:MAG: hypothetical protein RIG61_07675 [Deltaproteobacteria bacterium]
MSENKRDEIIRNVMSHEGFLSEGHVVAECINLFKRKGGISV